MSILYKPGTDNLLSGKYTEVGPRGGSISDSRIVHIDRGDRLPPTHKSGNRWKKS